MKTPYKTFLPMLGIIWLFSLWSVQTVSQADVIQTLAKDNADFAYDLYAQLRNQRGNLFFSPYSISTALAMTYAGAQGETARQMADVMHFNLKNDRLHQAFSELAQHFQTLEQQGHIALKVANALWIQEGLELLKDFLKLNETYYGSSPFRVNFSRALEEARTRINAWAARNTNGKIQELLQRDDIDPLTRLVLTNAIYFKGNWQNPFDEEKTRQESFQLTPQREIEVAMMYQQGDFPYTEERDAQVVSLPYAGGKLSMLVLLPFEHDGLADLEQRLNVQQINDWLATMQPRKLMVFLPKFSFSSRFELSKTLQQMGMRNAFSGKANFFGITPGKLFITKIIHEGFVEVNEQGTEATAATAVVMGRSMPPRFKADHPFLFLIRDTTTGSILFMGRVMNPTE